MELDYTKYRFQHTHIIGKADTDTLTTHLFLSDTARLIIDPVGDVAEDILKRIPHDPKVIYWDFSDPDYSISFNPLFNVKDKPATADILTELFLNVWHGEFQATNVIDCLYNSIAALLDYPNATLLQIKDMLTDKTFRKQVVRHIQNPVVLKYWTEEFTELTGKEQRELTRSTNANIHQVVADPRIRRLLCLPQPKLNLKDIMDKKKTLIVRIPQTVFGKRKTALLSSLMLASVGQAAKERTTRHGFHVYVRKAGLYSSSTLIELIDTIGQFNVSLTLSNTYMNELTVDLAFSTIGSVGTRYALKTGVYDAELLSTEISPRWNMKYTDLTRLPPGFYRLTTPLTDEQTEPAEKQIPTLPEEKNGAETIRANSRRLYGKSRAKLDKAIAFGA